MAEIEKDLHIVNTILKTLVSRPESVRIQRSVDEMGVFMRIWVAPDDMPLLIGRAGENARALRMIVRMIGYRCEPKEHITLKIEEPERTAN